MAIHHQFGEVWVINDSGFWSYIEDVEGETLVDIDHWSYKQKVDKDYVPLALIFDVEKALEWAQDRNREIAEAINGDEDVPSSEDDFRELNYQYNLSIRVT